MSGARPGIPGPTGRGMPVTPRAGTSPIPVTTIGSGMISPANAFVLPDGTLTGLSFRFLFEIWQAVNAQVPAQGAAIAALQTEEASLQAAINSILQRLTNAGIP